MPGHLSLELVSLALRQSRGVKTDAAQALDVTFGQLHRWMGQHEAELAELNEEIDALQADLALKTVIESAEDGGLKSSMFLLERKGRGFARKTEGTMKHTVERPRPEQYLPAVVDERALAVEQSKQLVEARPAEILDAEVETVVEAENVGADEENIELAVDEPPGGPYGPCPRCAANLREPGAYARSIKAKGSCASCGYPAVEQPQTIQQALQRH
jgi:hypothetical protein